jgi:alpha-galactosidase
MTQSTKTPANPEEIGHDAHSQKADGHGRLDRVNRPLNVVFLGAGSGFYEKLLIDILNIPGAESGTFGVVDIDTERLDYAERLGRKILEDAGKTGWSLTATTNRREVLPGADYIVNCIEVSGVECVRLDNDIPHKYGVDQCIGDTIGPGGLMKALRTVPVFLEVLEDIKELCPNAWVLNYTNPMSILCQSASLAGNDNVLGLCHSVQGTSHKLARDAEVPYEQMRWQCGGINHLAWFTELSCNGEDLYPILREKAQAGGDVYESDPVRYDMMLHFGKFVTESSGHFSEYLPYYRKRQDLMEKYCRAKYKGETGFYANSWPQWRRISDKRRADILKGVEVGGELPWAKPYKLDRTWEYASFIVEAMETNRPFVAHATVPNRGLIDNLSQNNVCEVAVLCDRGGAHPVRFGALEPQLAAICESNLRMFELAAIACVEKSREAAIHALMLDPLTAAVCSPAEIRQMAEELLEAEAKYIPELK